MKDAREPLPKKSREYAEGYLAGFLDCLEAQKKLEAEKEFIAQPVPENEQWTN